MNKLINQKKGGISSEMLFWVVVSAIAILVIIGLMNGGVFDSFSKLIGSGSCDASLDNEEWSYVYQERRGMCPCDIDDTTNEWYVGKYYTVNEKLYADSNGVARKLFDFENKYFADLNPKSNPFRISETDQKKMLAYVKEKAAGNDPTLKFSYILANKVKDLSAFDDLAVMCGNANNNACQGDEFMEFWFEEGVKTLPSCFTSKSVCEKEFKEACAARSTD